MSGAPVSSRHVADVLFAGLGVRAVVRDPIQGDLPLKLTPSGGARNPIDGYLVAIDVAGLPPGAYLYSGLRRDLEPVDGHLLPAASELLGGQPWAEGSAAVVFLVASLGRAMWKYEHPLSLRMVLLEAGHIAQNMLVAASDLGLASWPSGAISDSRVEELLEIGGPDRAVLYAVVLGRPVKAPRQRPSLDWTSASSRSGGIRDRRRARSPRAERRPPAPPGAARSPPRPARGGADFSGRPTRERRAAGSSGRSGEARRPPPLGARPRASPLRGTTESRNVDPETWVAASSWSGGRAASGFPSLRSDTAR